MRPKPGTILLDRYEDDRKQGWRLTEHARTGLHACRLSSIPELELPLTNEIIWIKARGRTAHWQQWQVEERATGAQVALRKRRRQLDALSRVVERLLVPPEG